MQHELKILPQYFKSVKEGAKTFEIRTNDRGFKVGDTLLLKEWYKGDTDYKDDIYTPCHYTNNEITKEITYIYEGEEYGLKKGWCVLGLKDTNEQQFQLGDIAYMIDEDYRFFESTVNRIDLNKGEYFYTTNDADFGFKDIGDWVFTSEMYRGLHLENKAGIGE